MAIENAGVYSIGAVAKMLGIPVQTLRSWEDRYKEIVPARSAGGQRLYSRDDVERLRFIREQTQAGLQPADAHRLLAERTRERARPDDGLRPHHGAGAGFAVLLAERDPYAASAEDYFLRTEGYTVRSVFDAVAAEQVIDENPPSVLVVDLMISGGAGLGLCRNVRDRTSIGVVAVSAVDCRDEALRAGVDAFLRKPFDPLQFVSTVRDLLGTSAYLHPGVALR